MSVKKAAIGESFPSCTAEKHVINIQWRGSGYNLTLLDMFRFLRLLWFERKASIVLWFVLRFYQHVEMRIFSWSIRGLYSSALSFIFCLAVCNYTVS